MQRRFVPAMRPPLAFNRALLSQFTAGNDIVGHSRASIIKNIPILKSAEPSLRTVLLNSMRPLTFMPGENIFAEGDASREMFFLLKGTVECSCVDSKDVLRSFATASAPPELLNALEHLREDLHLLHPPLFSPLFSPAPSVPPSHQRANYTDASDSESSDGDTAVPFDEAADDIFNLPQSRLLRAASFRLPTEASVPSNPIAAEFLLTGVTYSTIVPISATRFITHAYSDGNYFGTEALILGKTKARAYSCRATQPCDVMVISAANLLQIGKAFPDFLSEIRAMSVLRVAQIIKAKKALAQIASESPPLVPSAASIAIHPTQLPPTLDVFPHISDILAANSATTHYKSQVTLPAISVNDVPVPVESIPQGLFYSDNHRHSTQLHRTLRTVPFNRGLFLNDAEPSPIRILFTNITGVSFIKLKANEQIATNPAPPSFFLPEIEAVEDDTDLLRRAIFSDTSIWKIRWDCLIMLCVIICAVEIPFQLGFNVPAIDVLDNMINGFFIADMIVSFRTAYAPIDNDLLITTPWRIARTYLSSTFIVDLFSSIPLDSIFVATFAGNSDTALQARSIKLIRMARLFRLARLLRLLRASKMVSAVSSWLSLRPSVTAFMCKCERSSLRSRLSNHKRAT